MARRKATHVMTALTVEGSGAFPIDMLRYDACVPDGQEDVNKIWIDYDQEKERGLRQVNLRMYTPSDGRQGATHARWQSFLWRVVREEVR